MFPFASQVNNFFFVSRKFFAATVSRFLKARGAFMLLAASKSTTFFRFVKLCFTVEPVVFFNREERLCSPSLQESTVFFVSAKFHFACVSVNRFPSSRRAFMLHPAPQVNNFFRHSANSLCILLTCWRWASLQHTHIYGLIDSGRLDKQQLLPTMRDFAVRRRWDACTVRGLPYFRLDGVLILSALRA